MSKIGELRPGMEHLNFHLKVESLRGVREVKTYSGAAHRLLEGVLTDGEKSVGFVAWNEKIARFTGIQPGDEVELKNCFVSSFKGVLQVNVGRDSDARKTG